MYGIGEVCAQSGANDSPNNNGAGPAGPARRDLLPEQPGRASPTITDGTSNTIAVGERSHNLSYVTWVARSIDGWLGKTSPIEGGTDQFNPSPEECWTQVLGPAGLEDGPRTINNPEAHVEDYWSRHPGGANLLFADGSVRFLKNTHQPRPLAGPGHPVLRRGHQRRLVLIGDPSPRRPGSGPGLQAGSPTASSSRRAARWGLNSALSIR